MKWILKKFGKWVQSTGNANVLVILGALLGPLLLGCGFIALFKEMTGTGLILELLGMVLFTYGVGIGTGGEEAHNIINSFIHGIDHIQNIPSNLKSSIDSKIIRKFKLQLFLPKNRAEEILGDLAEVKSFMQETGEPKRKIWWYLTKTKLGIIIHHLFDQLLFWLKQQTKISK